MKIKLSLIPNWYNMEIDQIIEFCFQTGIETIINDFGSGMEFDLEDLLHVWEDIRKALT